MHDSTITSLAILKVNWDRGVDYLDLFLPFVAHCLSNRPRAEVALIDLDAAIREEFGIEIPTGALKSILKRGRRTGMVLVKDGIYHLNEARRTEFDLSATRKLVSAQNDGLVRRYMDFHSERFAKSIAFEDAEAAIHHFLDRYSGSVAKAVLSGSAPSGFPGSASAEYEVASFVEHLWKTDSEGFEHLEALVKGTLLANTVFFPDLGSVEKHLKNAELYFDTRLLLRALGYAGSEYQAPLRDLMDLAYELGAQLRCFSATLSEAQQVLEANAHVLRIGGRGGYGETLEHFLRSGTPGSDVMLYANRLEEHLKSLRVHVKDPPSHSMALTFDEARFEELLMAEVGYSSRESLLHDLDCATAIFRLRRGAVPARVEDSRALFVTNNTGVVRAAVAMLREELRVRNLGDEGRAVPLAIGDHTLGALLWLKRPSSVPNLPRQQVLADCYAALNPRDDLWRAYVTEIERLEQQGKLSKDDYYLLRYSSEASTALMDETGGKRAAFADGTVETVLRHAKEAVKSDAEVARREAERERLASEEGRLQAEQATSQERQWRMNSAAIARRRAVGMARMAVRLGKLVVVLLFIGGFTLTLPRPLSEWIENLPLSVASALILSFFVIVVIQFAFGTTLNHWARRLERRFAGWLEPRIWRAFYPSAASQEPSDEAY